MNPDIKQMHMTKDKGEFQTQITLNETCPLKEEAPRIKYILMKQHELKLLQVRTLEERVEANGVLVLEILYFSEEEGGFSCQKFELPFSDTIWCGGVSQKDQVNVGLELEDILVRVMRPDMLEVNAIIHMRARVCEIITNNILTVPKEKDDTCFYKQNKMDVLKLGMSRKETFFWKDEIEIEAGKPEVEKILFWMVYPGVVENRVEKDRLCIRGQMQVFIMYEAQEPQLPLQWLEKTIHFQGDISISGCEADMIPDVKVSLQDKNIQVKPDYEGAPKRLALGATLKLEINLYKEEELLFIEDAYALHEQVNLTYKEVSFDTLLVKNQARFKLTDRIKIDADAPVLQICYTNGEWRLDRCSWKKEGLLLEGALLVSLLYMTEEDETPMRVTDKVLPFSYTIEVKEHDDKTIYHVHPSLEQLSAVLVNQNEAEIRAGLAFDTLFVKQVSKNMVDKINTEPFAKENDDMGVMVGYHVKNGDTLWELAKTYHTTIQDIQKINGLTDENISEGQGLLLIRKSVGKTLDACLFEENDIAQ